MPANSASLAAPLRSRALYVASTFASSADRLTSRRKPCVTKRLSQQQQTIECPVISAERLSRRRSSRASCVDTVRCLQACMTVTGAFNATLRSVLKFQPLFCGLWDRGIPRASNGYEAEASDSRQCIHRRHLRMIYP